MKKILILGSIAVSIFAQNIELKSGWNLLGAIEDLNIKNSSCIEKSFNFQNRAWSSSGDIKQGNGFWAYSSKDCLFDTDSVVEVDRGSLVNSELVTTVDKTTLASLFKVLGLAIDTEYDVEIYRVSYKTINTDLELENLTGVISIPKGVDNVPILSYQHGTIQLIEDAPSSLDDDTQLLASLFTTTGFVTVMSDYLGYNTEAGFENKLHPYHLKEPTVSATLDLLRATKEFLTQKNLTFNEQLFLGGYSEGGYATMALDGALSQSSEFTVTASVPMAGAYDLNYTANYLIELEENHPTPMYFPFVVLAYNNMYKFTDTPESFFTENYKVAVDAFNNLENYTEEGLDALLSPDIKSMFDFSDNAGSYGSFKAQFEAKFEENSVYKYEPEGKVRLYHCKGDRDVPYQNSLIAYEYLKDRGDVTLVEIENSENLDHGTCGTPSLMSVIPWFASLKN